MITSDPMCQTCSWEKSHVRHHDSGLYNYHEFNGGNTMRVRAYVRIDHDFEVDVPEHLLEDGNEDLLDEHLYYVFEDSDWIFNELVLRDENGRII